MIPTALSAAFISAVALELGLYAAAGLMLARAFGRRARIRRRLTETCLQAAQRNRLARITEPPHGLTGALAAMRAGAVNDRFVEQVQGHSFLRSAA